MSSQDQEPEPVQDRMAAARQALETAEQVASSAPSRIADTSTDGPGLDDVVPASVRHDAEPDAYDVARAIALRQLTMAPRSRKELEGKLAQRGSPDDVTTAVLDRLTEVGLIDDQAYAQMVVRSRQETKGLASRALTHELRRKGVTDEHIDAALDGTTDEAERDQARALVDKRLRTLHGVGREVQTRRLGGFLARKGYGPALSYQVIREALDAAPEHQRD